MMRLLLLAGTGEARVLSEKLREFKGLEVVASLAGTTRQPGKMACNTRVGGFGGASGFARYLEQENISAVLDATHPFSVKMSSTAAQVCAENNLPHAQLLRPRWHPQPNDDWTMFDTESDVANHVEKGSIVFLATGRQTLDRFSNMSANQLICRQIDPPNQPFPFPNGYFLVGRPPFSVADEIALFTKLKVKWLVVKNSGGVASRTKLDAARELGIKVAMIKRPEQPDCNRVTSIDLALQWVSNVMADPCNTR